MIDQDKPFETLDALINAIYRTISGADNGERDWATQAKLFHPDARLMRSGFEGDAPFLTVMTPASYRENAGQALASRGFFEIETGRTIQQFGNFAHVLSTYEARMEIGGDIERRGVNSVQCYWDGRRWWIVNMIWDNEREGLSIPEAWLHG